MAVTRGKNLRFRVDTTGKETEKMLYFCMTTFDKILDRYRDVSFSERDKGTRFERLMKAYLLTDPKYKGNLKQVWLWEEFPQRQQFGNMDAGIDLVAETVDGQFWAIQCKCFGETQYIDKPEVDTFLSTSGRSFTNADGNKIHFTLRLWISTTEKWTSNAEVTLQNQNPPVSRISLNELRNAPVDWDKLESGVHGELARTEKHSLKPHQETAVAKVHEHFKTKNRGKLIMACGTGKSFTSLKIAELEANKLVVVLVPSIALVGQILREWTDNTDIPINPICVCSDPKVSQQKKLHADMLGGFTTIDLGLPATTDPRQIVKQYQTNKDYRLTVIFSTYQSIDQIQLAQKHGLPEIDIIICDEAHRTTGVTLADDDESTFVRVHDNDFIKASKRLYMTATPRLYKEEAKTKAQQANAVLCSMDDETIYGAEIHRIGFGEAVEKGLLTDYKVLIFTVSDKDIPKAFQQSIARDNPELPADTGAKIAGCINALSKQVWGAGCETITEVDPQPMRRAVAFCQNIKNSTAISGLFNSLTTQYINALPEDRRGKMVGISSRHIDGSMNAPKREELLNWLKTETQDNSCRILSNVRCLSEGVDVPALDAVMFLSARNSQVDVVQSVGRVMRKSPNKKYGYIIIPVVVPSDVEPERALDDNARYQVVWSVLNALRAHDDRFNATINKIDLNKKRPDSIIIGGSDTTFGENGEVINRTFEQMHMDSFGELQNVIFARLVQKVGDRRYWEQWAESVAQIAERQITKITANIDSWKETGDVFKAFLKEMQISIDASIDRQRAIEMLAQHTITAPVFNALFENYAFAENNAVSVAMSKMLAELEAKGGISKDTDELKSFYESVKKRAEGIDNAEARQRIIIELYDTFFKTAFPKMTQQLGIVYTPVEVVDFIIHSVNDVLQAEFGRKLADENVNILDPFTGTGTFITRLIQSGLISKDDLPRKYEKELFANELVLLAYYIACVNIENCFHDEMGANEYKPFEGIALTDTFQAYEESKTETRLLGKNSATVRRQNNAPLTVIFGNPPYSIGQESANDDAQNNAYPKLDMAIETTYAKNSTAGLKRSLYDSYIRAFRYATDRLKGVEGNDCDGIICYVSNGAWLDGNSTDGFRKSIEQEFSKIYVFNLRGNQRTSGELSRKEGGKIFGSGSRTPVSITLLVKRNGHKGKAQIFYRDIGDYLGREEKLLMVKLAKSFTNEFMELQQLNPSKNGDWITERNEVFNTLIPLMSDKQTKIIQSAFAVTSCGFVTSRDSWLYNFSSTVLQRNAKNMVSHYNSLIGQKLPKNLDSTKISWSRGLDNFHKTGKTIQYESDKTMLASYRPFSKQWVYYGEKTMEMRYKMEAMFPTKNTDNLTICVTRPGTNKDFSALMTDTFADYHFTGDTQCFPLYYYEKISSGGQVDMFTQTDDQYIRHNGISDFIFAEATKRYGNKVTREDIFYYVYGLLHSPKYREAFAVDLKKSLPRIPLVDSADDFWAFSKAGRALSDLHLNYENVPAPRQIKVTKKNDNLRVDKMRFLAKDRKDTILFNSSITIENIPLSAYDYIVNGKSAIEWIMERYQIKTDKASGITNDPNKYADEIGKPSYILDLLLSIITVSLETNKTVASLPDISFDGGNNG